MLSVSNSCLYILAGLQILLHILSIIAYIFMYLTDEYKQTFVYQDQYLPNDLSVTLTGLGYQPEFEDSFLQLFNLSVAAKSIKIFQISLHISGSILRVPLTIIYIRSIVQKNYQNHFYAMNFNILVCTIHTLAASLDARIFDTFLFWMYFIKKFPQYANYQLSSKYKTQHYYLIDNLLVYPAWVCLIFGFVQSMIILYYPNKENKIKNVVKPLPLESQSSSVYSYELSKVHQTGALTNSSVSQSQYQQKKEGPMPNVSLDSYTILMLMGLEGWKTLEMSTIDEIFIYVFSFLANGAQIFLFMVIIRVTPKTTAYGGDQDLIIAKLITSSIIIIKIGKECLNSTYKSFTFISMKKKRFYRGSSLLKTHVRQISSFLFQLLQVIITVFTQIVCVRIIWETSESDGVIAVLVNFTAAAVILEIDDYAGDLMVTLISLKRQEGMEELFQDLYKLEFKRENLDFTRMPQKLQTISQFSMFFEALSFGITQWIFYLLVSVSID